LASLSDSHRFPFNAITHPQSAAASNARRRVAASLKVKAAPAAGEGFASSAAFSFFALQHHAVSRHHGHSAGRSNLNWGLQSHEVPGKPCVSQCRMHHKAALSLLGLQSAILHSLMIFQDSKATRLWLGQYWAHGKVRNRQHYSQT